MNAMSKRDDAVDVINNLRRSLPEFAEFFDALGFDGRKLFVDSLAEDMYHKDFLVQIFNQQLNIDAKVLSTKAKWVPTSKDTIIAMLAEAFEMLQETEFKWWSNKNVHNGELKKVGLLKTCLMLTQVRIKRTTTGLIIKTINQI